MNEKRLNKLLLECVKKEIQALAQDANLCEMYGMSTPHYLEASARRKELREIVAILKGASNSPPHKAIKKKSTESMLPLFDV